MAGVKIASNVFSNVRDHSCELSSVLMVEKFWQRHGPVEPGVEDFGLFRVICGNKVIHGWNVATSGDLDLLSWFDYKWRKCVSFGADLVGGNGADGVHKPRVVPEAVDFLPGGGDPELAIAFDERRAAMVERAKTVIDNVCLENRAALAEKWQNCAFTVSPDMRKVYRQRAACSESSLLANTLSGGVC